MSCVPWEGEHLLCVKVTLISVFFDQPRGGMWWVMGFQIPEIPVLSLAALCCWPCAEMGGGGMRWGKLAAAFVAFLFH